MKNFEICTIEHYKVYYTILAESKEEAIDSIGEAQEDGFECIFNEVEYCEEVGE